MIASGASPLNIRLVASLRAEATALTAEARAYFDGVGHADRDALAPMERVAFAREALKVTTRLMQAVLWLSARRAVFGDERREARAPAPGLGAAPDTDAVVLASLPEAARALIVASADLHRRVARLDTARQRDPPTPAPPGPLRDRLALVPKAR